MKFFYRILSICALLCTLCLPVMPAFASVNSPGNTSDPAIGSGNKSLLLVRCGVDDNGTARPNAHLLGVDAQGQDEYECQFRDVFREIKLLINFAFLVSVPITLIAISWSGIQILLAQGNTAKITEARKLMTKVLTGFFFILIAWLLVYELASRLLQSQYYTPFIGGPSNSEKIN